MRWADIIGRPTFRWGTVTAREPALLVRLDGDASGTNAHAAGYLTGRLAVGERVWTIRDGRSLVVVGRSGTDGPSWEYDVATANAGWVTVARHESTRTRGRFVIVNSDASNHEELTMEVNVSYGQATIDVVAFNCFGRSAPGITAARYLRSSSDPTYGQGLLQIKLADTITNWNVVCQQENQAWMDLWTPMNFSTSTTGYSTTPLTQVGIYPSATHLLTPTNGYDHFSAAPSWDELRVTYRSGIVTMSGLIAIGAATSQTVLTLPEGLRPVGDLIFGVYAYTGSAVLGRLQITDTGVLSMTTPAYGTAGHYISASGITYPAYQ